MRVCVCVCVCVLCVKGKPETINVHPIMVHTPDSTTMLLLGRVPGYKDSDVKLLPSSTTKHHLPPGSSNKPDEGSCIINLHTCNYCLML